MAPTLHVMPTPTTTLMTTTDHPHVRTDVVGGRVVAVEKSLPRTYVVPFGVPVGDTVGNSVVGLVDGYSLTWT